jgi:Arc/MetJ-type ribon-helix-helix transcriptional regulator
VSIQIAVRLPDHLVAEVDRLVASGVATSRTEVVTSALERELRRRIHERDLALVAVTGEDDDLD